jgi:hypothetical protein
MIKITPIIHWLLIVVVTAVATTRALGRTIELSEADADRIAVIGPEAPRLSWAAYEVVPGMWVDAFVDLRPRAALLIHIPLDKIPANSRISRADWIFKPTAATAGETKLYIWRVLADWGPGVCYQYRMIRPKRVEWAEPGARGNASDRSERPTVAGTCKTGEEVVLNVTQDVELWHSGAAINRGWMFTVEDDVLVRLAPPVITSVGNWKLRITYEPR